MEEKRTKEKVQETHTDAKTYTLLHRNLTKHIIGNHNIKKNAY